MVVTVPSFALPAVTTTYTLTATDATNCTSTSEVTLTVASPPIISVDQPTLTLCAGATGTVTASGANTYVWQPGNITGATLSGIPSVNTTLTVTGTDANGCTATTTVQVISTPLIVLNASASDNQICAGETTSLSATGGSVYTWNPGNLTGSTVSVSPTATTTYTVVSDDGTGCTGSTTVTVIVFPVPAPVISSPTAICAGATANLSVTGAPNITWEPGNLGGNFIQVSPATTTTYTATSTSLNGCTATATVTVTVNPNPTVTLTPDNQTVCFGQTASVTANSPTGVSFLWSAGTPNNLPTLSGIPPQGVSTYTVLVTDANGCTVTAIATVNAQPGPDMNLSVNNVQICENQDAVITVQNPQLNVDYEVVTQAGVVLAGPVQTIGGPLPIVVFAADLNPGVNLVGIRGTLGTCTSPVLVPVAITVQNPPFPFTATANPTCFGQPAIVNVSGSIPNGEYLIFDAADNLVAVGFGDGNPITVSIPAGNLALGLNQFTIRQNNVDCLSESAPVNVIVTPSPVTTLVVAGSAVCPGTDGTVTVSASQANVSYQLQDAGGNLVGTPVVGTGGTISLTVPAAVLAPGGNPFTVLATLTFGAVNNSCTAPLDNQATVTLNPAPDPLILVLASNACQGQNITATVLNSQPGVRYTFATGEFVDGTGGDVSVALATATQSAGSYTVAVVAGDLASGCSQPLANPLTYSILPLPSFNPADFVQNAACAGTDALITLANTDDDFTYQIFDGLTPLTPVTAGTGGTLPFTLPTSALSAGVYNYTLEIVSGLTTCTNTFPVQLTIDPLPNPNLVVAGSLPGTPVCLGQPGTVTVQASEPGVTYQVLNAGGQPVALNQVGTGAVIVFTIPAAQLPLGINVFTVTGTSAQGCFSILNTPASIEVVDVPDATLGVTADNGLCQNVDGTVTVSPTENGIEYTVFVNGVNTGLTQPGTGAPIVFTVPAAFYQVGNNTITVEAVNPVTGCSVGLTQVPLSIILPAPQPAITSNTGSFTGCEGDVLTLTAPSGFATYQWSTGETTTSIQVNTSQTVSVSVTDNNGCIGSSGDVIVTIRPLPTITLVASQTLACLNSQVVITASGGVSYSWSPVLGSLSPDGSVQTFTVTSARTFTVTGFDGFCSNTATISIDVQFLSVDAGENLTLAQAGNVTLGGTPTITGGSGNYIYQWTPVTGLNDPTSANPTAFITEQRSYTVTVTDVATGCQFTDDIVIIFINVPPAPLQAFAQALQDPSACPGTSVQLLGEGIGGVFPYTTFRWYPGTSVADSLSKNTLANPAVTTVYTLEVTDASGASATTAVMVVVKPKPTINAGADRNICLSASTVLGGTPTAAGGVGQYTYTWFPTTGLSNPHSPNPVATPTVTTDYILTVADSNNCLYTDTVRVFVAAFPLVLADAGPTTFICSGQSVQANPAVAGGQAPYTYTWAPATGLSSTSLANPVVNPAQTTIYTLTVVDANGCVATDTVRYIVLPKLMAEAGLSRSVCAGTTVTLGGNPTVSQTLPNQTFTYVWSPITAFVNPFTANPVVKVDTTTKFYVTVTDNRGCVAVDSVIITALPKLLAEAGPNQIRCGQGTVQLQGSASGGSGVYTYRWLPGNLVSDSTAAVTSAQPTTLTVFTLLVTDAAGCQAIDQVVVNVAPSSVAVQVDNSIVNRCNPSYGVSIGATATGGLGVYTYRWSPATGLNDSTLRRPVAKPDQTTTYTVRVQDPNGCVALDTVRVVVSPSLLSDVLIVGDTALCMGSSNTVTLAVNLSPGVAVVAWLRNGVAVSGATSSSFKATQPGTYQVVVEATTGCRDTSDASQGIIRAYNAPAKPQIGLDSLNRLTASAQPGVTFQWYLNDQPIAGATDSVFRPLQTGVYRVQVRGVGGCAVFSDPFTLSTITSRGTSASNAPFALTVYPNPFADELTLVFDPLTGIPANVQVKVYDVVGKLVVPDAVVINLTGSTAKLSLQSLAQGIYWLHFQSGEHQQAIRVVKQ